MYKSIYYNENKDKKRINTDEIVARIGSQQVIDLREGNIIWKDKNMPGWSNDLIATSLKRDPKEPNLGNDIGLEF